MIGFSPEKAGNHGFQCGGRVQTCCDISDTFFTISSLKRVFTNFSASFRPDFTQYFVRAISFLIVFQECDGTIPPVTSKLHNDVMFLNFVKKI